GSRWSSDSPPRERPRKRWPICKISASDKAPYCFSQYRVASMCKAPRASRRCEGVPNSRFSQFHQRGPKRFLPMARADASCTADVVWAAVELKGDILKARYRSTLSDARPAAKGKTAQQRWK